MKLLLLTFSTLMLSACMSTGVNIANNEAECIGSNALPATLRKDFELIQDTALLEKALGAPNAGGLCQGQVYQSKKDVQVTLFRAWNSTNPSSKLGPWWAFEQPEGNTAKYRSDYEICYQWSPIDSLVTCTLKPNVKVVVGTGQSATCSEFLTYPVSAKQQIYISDAENALSSCTVLESQFSWK